jgi:hypothetical protein
VLDHPKAVLTFYPLACQLRCTVATKATSQILEETVVLAAKEKVLKLGINFISLNCQCISKTTPVHT